MIMSDKFKIWMTIAEEKTGISIEQIHNQTLLDKNTVETIVEELLLEGIIYESSFLKFKST